MLTEAQWDKLLDLDAVKNFRALPAQEKPLDDAGSSCWKFPTPVEAKGLNRLYGKHGYRVASCMVTSSEEDSKKLTETLQNSMLSLICDFGLFPEALIPQDEDQVFGIAFLTARSYDTMNKNTTHYLFVLKHTQMSEQDFNRIVSAVVDEARNTNENERIPEYILV